MRTRGVGAKAAVRAAVLAVIVGGGVILLSACAFPARPIPPSGANDPEVVAARTEAAAAQQAALASIAMGEPISTGVQDSCARGSSGDPWRPRDTYYWACRHWTSWVVATDVSDPAQLIEAYRAHLVEVGCTPDESSFDMVADYWATLGIPGENVHGDPYTVDDLPDAGAACPDAPSVGIGFRSAAGLDTSTISAFPPVGGEIIIDQQHDQAAVAARAPQLVVVLGTGTGYHTVSRTPPEPSSTPQPGYCACYSGSPCDCPGG